MPLLPFCLLAAALGQAPAEDALLDAVPAEADVVLRARGLAPARDDLMALLKAASPRFAAQAGPALDAGLAQLREHVGDAAATPFVIAVRAVPPEKPGPPPMAILLKTADYEGFLKGIADNKDVAIKHEGGGVDSFVEKNGDTLYAASAGGLIGFGPDRTQIAAFAKAGGKGRAKAMPTALRARFLAGDVGVYVDLATLTDRYKDAIAQARKQMVATLDQAAPQLGGAAMAEITKTIYAGFFDSLQEAGALALSVDVSADGAAIDGALALKPGSKTLASIAGATPGDPASLGKLPADATTFMYMNLDPRSFEAFQKLTLGWMLSGNKPSPELAAALDRQREAGRIEAITAMTMFDGMKTFSAYTQADPEALQGSAEAMMKAMKSSDSPLNFFKDLTISRGVQSLDGYTFDRIEMTIDRAKVEKFAAGNPAQAAQMQKMIGGDKLTSWYGQGKSRILQLTGPDWARAKAQVDAFEKGQGTLGATKGFGEAMGRMPKQANVVMLVSVQGLVRQVAAQMGGPPAEGLPKEPVLIGASLTTVPKSGFEFRVFVPAAVGGIIEKRMGGPAPGNP